MAVTKPLLCGEESCGHSLAERLLRADDDHPDLVLIAELLKPVDFTDSNGNINRLAKCRKPGILRIRDPQIPESARLDQFLRESMFPAPTTDQQHIHLP